MSLLRTSLSIAVSACAVAIAAPASAGVLDGIFGGATAGADVKSDSRRRIWPIRDFSSVQLAAREAGAKENQHPAQLNADVLRQQLGKLRFASGNTTRALFTQDEAEELVEPLVLAFAAASPADDVVLASSARRGDAVLLRPMAVTARLFVQGGSLQFIVRDARYDFYNDYMGTKKDPTFTYGSRNAPGAAVLGLEGASVVRGDWLALPLAAAGGAAGGAGATPTAPVRAPAPAATTLPAPAATPALRPRDPGFADEVEQRLTTLKRLRDRGLITEEEYQQKRREILQAL